MNVLPVDGLLDHHAGELSVLDDLMSGILKLHDLLVLHQTPLIELLRSLAVDYRVFACSDQQERRFCHLLDNFIFQHLRCRIDLEHIIDRDQTAHIIWVVSPVLHPARNWLLVLESEGRVDVVEYVGPWLQ